MAATSCSATARWAACGRRCGYRCKSICSSVASSFETREDALLRMTDSTDVILRSLPPGPREARPDDKLRKRLEGWTQHVNSRPSFETRASTRSPSDNGEAVTQG